MPGTRLESGPLNSPVNSPVTRRERAWAALGCALLATLFLSPALGPGRVFSPADVLYTHYPWRAQPPAGWPGPGNALVGEDSAFVFEPWLIYSAHQLQQGALPLWNPNNLLGVPLIGNMQSAVFSPLTWPYFLWPDPGTLVVPAWLKLWLTALGLYLLAREALRCGRLAAAIATIAFSLGAFMTIWLLYPLTSTVTWLPWLWWATARLVDAPSRRRLAGLAGLVALSLVAGHPETALHSAEATGAFALFYAWQAGPGSVRRVGQRLGWWLGAYALGGLLAAVQLLPFLDYLAQSTVWLTRGSQLDGPWLPFRYAWALVSPSLLGSPADRTWWASDTTYNEITTYCGVVPLLLAPLALWAGPGRQRRFALFLLGLAGVSLGVVYHWPVVFEVVTALPLMHLVANQRLLVFVQLALALLAAFGLESIRARLPGARRPLMLLLAGVTTFWFVAGLAVPWLLARDYFAIPADPSRALALWQGGLWRTAGLLAAGGGLLAGAAALGARRPRLAAGLLWLLPALLLADLGLAYGGYNPTMDRAAYYPATPATQFLQQQQAAQGPLRVVAANRTFPPAANLPYGLADPRNYDALEPQLFHELAILIEPAIRLKPGGSPTVFRSVHHRLLNLFDVRYVLAAPDEDPNYVPIVRQEAGGDALDAIGAGARPGQTFVAPADNLAAIQVRGSTAGGHATGTLVFHLQTDPAAPADLVTKRLDVAQLPDGDYWWIRFPPIRQARGRHFYFYFAAPDAPTSPAAGLFYSPAAVYAAGTRRQGDQSVPGALTFRALALPEGDAAWFTRVLNGGRQGASVFENQQALPRAWIAHALEILPAGADQLARLADPAFDPAQTAILADPLPDGQGLPAVPPLPRSDAVQITRYAPEDVEIAARNSAAGLLVLSDQVFSGWAATLDGRPVPILTADHALRAVYLPAGAHQVRFVYQPAAFYLGAGVSGAALGLLILLAAWPATSWRRPRRPPLPPSPHPRPSAP